MRAAVLVVLMSVAVLSMVGTVYGEHVEHLDGITVELLNYTRMDYPSSDFPSDLLVLDLKVTGTKHYSFSFGSNIDLDIYGFDVGYDYALRYDRVTWSVGEYAEPCPATIGSFHFKPKLSNRWSACFEIPKDFMPDWLEIKYSNDVWKQHKIQFNSTSYPCVNIHIGDHAHPYLCADHNLLDNYTPPEPPEPPTPFNAAAIYHLIYKHLIVQFDSDVKLVDRSKISLATDNAVIPLTNATFWYSYSSILWLVLPHDTTTGTGPITLNVQTGALTTGGGTPIEPFSIPVLRPDQGPPLEDG